MADGPSVQRPPPATGPHVPLKQPTKEEKKKAELGLRIQGNLCQTDSIFQYQHSYLHSGRGKEDLD